MTIFEELYPFLDLYTGCLKIYDFDTADVLYKSDKGYNIDPMADEFADCEVNDIYVEGGCLIIQITYSFHEIQE